MYIIIIAISDKGIQCDRLNKSDVTQEPPDANVKNGDDFTCDIEDADDAVDDECDFDINEEERDYNQTFLS